MSIQSDNIEAMLTRLVPDPDAPDVVDSGNPEMLIAALTEGAIESGVWTCTVGSWEELDYPVDEVILMLDGALRLTDADGTTRELRAGDFFYIPKGWVGRWEVVEDMRKVYVIVT